MRDDLHRMEQADRYLDGAMSAAERSEFEATAAASPELRQVIDEQRALREGMQRLHLRGVLSAAHRGWVLKQWMPKIITLLIVGGLVSAGTWYWKEHPHLFQFEEQVPELSVPADTLQEESAGQVTIPMEVRVRRDSVIDTVMYLIKDGKRIRVDSIPKGARIIGTEIHRKMEPDSAGASIDQTPASSSPMNESVHSMKTVVAEPTKDENAGLNDLTTEKGPARNGKSTEMQIHRPKNSDAQPQYPGGFDAMYLFMKKNVQVPDGLKKSGTVVVSFVVDAQGDIKEPTIEQSLSKACNEEALRVVQTMPKWIPCQAEGKPVPSRIQLPLTFTPGKVKNKPSESELVPVNEQPVKIPRQLRNGGG